MIKDVTDASDWSKRFNFYISGLLPIFSEFSRFISRFSELKKAPSIKDLWSKDFFSSTGNFHQNQSELLSIDQKKRFEFKQLVFFHFILWFLRSEIIKIIKNSIFCLNRSFFSQKYPNFSKFIFKLTSK